MPSVAEMLASKVGETNLAASLASGVTTLSDQQTITFTKYVRLVLPIDGFVFWVKASLTETDATLNAAPVNGFKLNASGAVNTTVPGPNSFTVTGALHYATNVDAEAETGVSVSEVIFTALNEVQSLRAVAPNTLYVGEFDGVRFAFGQRRQFFQQAGLYHYTGTAIKPYMASQFIDALDGFDSKAVVCSNSMPIWLSLDPSQPPVGLGLPSASRVPIYPAFQIPRDLPTPYATVMIPEDSVTTLQPTPYLDFATTSNSQLCEDTVEMTLYGVGNDIAKDLVDYVYAMSAWTDLFGVMNSPVPRDMHRNQPEYGTLAQAKKLTFRVNYYQQRVRDFAQKVISSCVPTLIVRDGQVINDAPVELVILGYPPQQEFDFTTDQGAPIVVA